MLSRASRLAPLPLTQAIGATTPAFTAVLAVLIVRRWEQPLTYATLFPVILGVVIASRGEPGFHLAGFLLGVASTVCRALKSVLQQVRPFALSSRRVLPTRIAVASALPPAARMDFAKRRWNPTTQSVATAQAARGWARPPCRRFKNQSCVYVLGMLSSFSQPQTPYPPAQVLLSENGVKLDSLNALRLMCPWAVLGLVPAAWLIEGAEPWGDVGYLWDNRYTSYGGLALVLNIGMAFLVNLLNLLVTKHTNALAVQVRPPAPNLSRRRRALVSTRSTHHARGAGAGERQRGSRGGDFGLRVQERRHCRRGARVLHLRDGHGALHVRQGDGEVEGDEGAARAEQARGRRERNLSRVDGSGVGL